MKLEISSYTEEQGPILEEGVPYNATLTGFGETDGKWGPRLVWRFDVEDPESGETVEAAAFTSYSTFAGNDSKGPSNLVKYAIALHGEVPLDEDGDLETDFLIGESGRVITGTYERANGIVKNIVTNVLPAKKSAAV